MKYAYFNDRPLFGKRTGVGHYLDLVGAHWPTDATITLRGLSESMTGGRTKRVSSRFVFPDVDALSRVELETLNKLTPTKDRGRVLNRTLRMGYELATNRACKRAARRDDFAVLFEPNHLPSAPVQPCVATIHDLSVIELPEFHPEHRVDWWKRRMERAMGTTDRFVCVSQATADAMVRVLGCSPDRLEVIELASRWGAAPESWTPSRVRTRLGVPERYWLHVGTIEPRKNIGRLLDAYATLPKVERERTKLVLCGRVGWGKPSFWESLCDHPVAGEVLTAGYCDDAQVAGLMVGSLGVLCPSHYEGFGLPTIEAMTLGVPNAISNAPSLIEIAAGTVPEVDPADTQGWAEVMMQISESPDSAMVDSARVRAGEYSWDATAQAHHDLFASMAAKG